MAQIRLGGSEDCPDPGRKLTCCQEVCTVAWGDISKSTHFSSLLINTLAVCFIVGPNICTVCPQTFPTSLQCHLENELHADALWHSLLKLLLQNDFCVSSTFKILKKKKKKTDRRCCLVTAVLYLEFPGDRPYIINGKKSIYIGNSLVSINISDDTCRRNNWLPLRLMFTLICCLPSKKGAVSITPGIR